MENTKKCYGFTTDKLSIQEEEFLKINETLVKHFIVPVDNLNRSVLKTLNYAKCLSNDIVAFHISTNDDKTEYIKINRQSTNLIFL